MNLSLTLTACLALLPISSAMATERADAATNKTAIHFIGLIRQMEKIVATLRDTTYLFHKQEYANGKQQAAERMAVKFRAPNDIYLKWLGPTYAGRELLFRSNANDGRLRVNMGRWLPTLNLAPNGYLALRGNRHGIEQLPFAAIVANFMQSAQLLAADPNLDAHITTLDALSQQQHFGEAAHCYDIRLPKAQQPQLYAERSIICISLRTQLPVRIQSWDREDGELRQVENYGYENVQINIGLSDRDFAEANPAYDF